MDFFCLEKQFFLLPEKNQNFRKLVCKTRYSFVKLPEKIRIFRKFACRNRNFFDPDPRPPRFQTRLTPLLLSSLEFSAASSEIMLPKLQDSLTCSIISPATTIFII